MSRRFGPVRQMGYVVQDVARAREHFARVLGLGPFFTMPSYPVLNYEFGGRRSEPVLSVAIAYSGPVQIELIQPLMDTPSFYRELLGQGHPGPHYVTYWVRDFDAALAEAKGEGAEVVQSGGVDGAGLFAYLREPGGPIFELLQTNEVIEAWFGGMQAITAGWDGVTEPVRPAMP